MLGGLLPPKINISQNRLLPSTYDQSGTYIPNFIQIFKVFVEYFMMSEPMSGVWNLYTNQYLLFV